MGAGGAGGGANCAIAACDASAFCGIVTQNGRIDIRECVPYPNGCLTCECAEAQLAEIYKARFPQLALPPCRCSDGANPIADAGTSANLRVTCNGA